MKLKVPPVLVFIISFGITKLIHLVTSGFQLTIPFGQYISITLLALGVAIGLAGVLEFRRHKTTVDPTQPAKASTIVTTGVYRYTRNPMYLGLAVGLFGLIVYYGNPLGLVSLFFYGHT